LNTSWNSALNDGLNHSVGIERNTRDGLKGATYCPAIQYKSIKSSHSIAVGTWYPSGHGHCLAYSSSTISHHKSLLFEESQADTHFIKVPLTYGDCQLYPEASTASLLS
jgi:hypothetical protein